MNYTIYICGIPGKMFDILIKLISQTAKASDYLVKLTAYDIKCPHSNAAVKIDLVGSALTSSIGIVLDLNESYESTKQDIYISPSVLEIEVQKDKTHYWKILGVLFKIIPDFSPAYVTSHLLETFQHGELAIFKQYLTQELTSEINKVLEKNFQ